MRVIHTAHLSTGPWAVGADRLHGVSVPKTARTPAEIDTAPFRGSKAVDAGALTPAMLRSPAWRRLFFDVYVRASAFDVGNHHMWCEATALMLPKGAGIGGWSAAYLHGVDVLPKNAPVWVSLCRVARLRPRNRLHIQRTPLHRNDLDAIGGIPITTGLRTAFDLGRYLPREEALVSLDALCHELVKCGELEQFVTDRWSWPRTRQIRGLLSLIEPLSESPMESRVRLTLVDAGLPRPVAQLEIRSPDGQLLGRVDLAYPEWKIAIEYEGDHHRERQRSRRDVARVNALREAGWLVLQFTANDVFPALRPTGAAGHAGDHEASVVTSSVEHHVPNARPITALVYHWNAPVERKCGGAKVRWGEGAVGRRCGGAKVRWGEGAVGEGAVGEGAAENCV